MCIQVVRPFNYFFIIALIFFFSSRAFATAEGPDFLDVRDIGAGDQLRIHLKPADSSQLIRKIPHNATCLKNLGCKGEDSNWWCEIVYQGTSGWVAGRFVKEGFDCLSSFSSDIPERSTSSSPEVFTGQLLVGKTVYNQEKDTYVELSFQKSNVKSWDGTIVFTFLNTPNCLPDTTETLPYRLQDGKIIYYANDGSQTRLTLQKRTATSWVVLEEEDIDGDGSQFDFSPAGVKVYDLDNQCK